MSQAGRTLAVLVVLLIAGLGLGWYAWKGVYEGDEKETKQKDVDEHLFSVPEPGQVSFVKLRIESGGETSVLERASAAEPWRMASPIPGAGVDRIAVDGVTSQLQAAKFKYVADESPDAEALKKYGLETPLFVVEADALVGDAGVRRSVKLKGGAENPFNGSIFMQRNDEKKVWGAEGGVKWSFSKTPFELREKEVVALEEQQISKVSVKTKNNEYTLERDVDRNWQVKSPRPEKGEESVFLADQGAISGAINGFKNERATAFPTGAVSFDQPLEELTFTQGDETVQVKLQRSSGADAGGDHVYLWREDKRGTLVAEVGPNALSYFDRHPWDLRDRAVLQLRRDAVAKVQFHLADRTEIVVEKDASDAGAAETWRVTAPKPGPAKQFKMAALLWTLGSVKATEVIEEHPKDVKKYGFDRWIALFGSDGRELGRFLVGAEVKGKEGQKYLKGTRDQVVTGDGTRLADLPAKLDDLLDAPPPLPQFDAGL